MKKEPVFNESDKGRVQQLLAEYVHEKQCSVDNTHQLCQMLKVKYQQQGGWEYMKV